MKEHDQPVNFEQKRLMHIFKQIAYHRGILGELEMEVQRIQMGRKPQDLSPVLSPRDRLFEQTIDFNKPKREQQASTQSDIKL